MADFLDLWSNGAKGVATTALGKALQARATQGVLYGMDGWTSEGSTVYICVFDSAAAVPSGNPPTTWPKHIIEIDKPGNGNFGLTEPPVAEYYANGIYIAVSTTALPNFTLTTNNNTHINCQTGPIFGSGEP